MLQELKLISVTIFFLLKVHLFWLQMVSGNHFPPNPRVWQQRKIKFSGKSFPVDQQLLLWPGNYFTPLFSLQFISGKREREREREKREPRLERERESPDCAAHRTIAPTSPPLDVAFTARSHLLLRRIWFIFFCCVLFLLLRFVSFAGFDAFSVKMFEWTKHRN